MIFADKLIGLRKKNGWTQEELAEQMDVSRQSITKWEGAQSIPELSKIIKLSQIFGVSTDYLLKDDMEAADHVDNGGEDSSVRRVSMEEANRFLKSREEAAKPIALATLICILSPICLLVLGVMSEAPKYGVPENTAGGIGLCVLFIMAAIAVVLYVRTGSKNQQYAYLEKEAFDTEYGVIGMVKERRAQYKPVYDRLNLIGIVICVLAVLPIFAGMLADSLNDMLMVLMVCLTLVLVGVGVSFLIYGGVIWSSYEKLMQDGDYSMQNKKRSPLTEAITTAYWLIATAVYLGYSFTTNDWKNTWIVWLIAGVLFPALLAIVNASTKK